MVVTVEPIRANLFVTQAIDEVVHVFLLLSSDLSCAGQNTNDALASKLRHVPYTIHITIFPAKKEQECE